MKVIEDLDFVKESKVFSVSIIGGEFADANNLIFSWKMVSMNTRSLYF